MYEELVNALRRLGDWSIMDFEDNLSYANHITEEAANAIEELQKAVYFHKYNSEFWEDKYNSLADEKWIPVTERLPENSERVLIHSGDYVGCGLYTREFWKDEYHDYVIVTHWMPLPEPPKEET